MEEEAFKILEKRLEQLQKLKDKISPEEYAKREAALLDQLVNSGKHYFVFMLICY